SRRKSHRTGCSITSFLTKLILNCAIIVLADAGGHREGGRKMPDVLVRNVDVAVLERLKNRAARKGRSLQAELQDLLRDASEKKEPLSQRETLRRIRSLISNKNQTDS